MIDSRLVDDDARTTQSTDALICLECGEESPDVPHGWRAYTLAGELLIYCPTCAAREFEDDD
jgi:hypothetical protein